MMRLCVLAMLALAASVRPALSCSCMASGPACQAYWKTDAVFDATVVDVQTEIRPVPSSFLSDSVVVLQVGQSWKGASVGRLEVTTSAYESACGYPFRKGVRYLVFARTGLDGIQPYGFESASAYSDNDGYFTVGGLAPGRYVVGINLNDLPGDSITIGSATPELMRIVIQQGPPQ